MSISSTHSQIQTTTLTSITVPMNLGQHVQMILEARTNVTKKNERILIKDLISYKLKHRTKEARLILQSGIYNFCYQYFGQHGLVLFMWSPKKCIISTATLSFSYIFFFLNSSAFHLNSFWKKRGELDMYLLEMMIKEFMVSRVFL